MRAIALIFVSLCCLPQTAAAQGQHLIPPPYPSGGEGARTYVAPPATHHQMLIPTPYPRTLGPNALGNPRSLRVQRHQRLIKPPYPRQYR